MCPQLCENKTIKKKWNRVNCKWVIHKDDPEHTLPLQSVGGAHWHCSWEVDESLQLFPGGWVNSILTPAGRDWFGFKLSRPQDGRLIGASWLFDVGWSGYTWLCMDLSGSCGEGGCVAQVLLRGFRIKTNTRARILDNILLLREFV